MRKIADRRTIGALAGLAAATLIAAGCGGNDSSTVAATTTGSAGAGATTSATPAGSATAGSASAAAGASSSSTARPSGSTAASGPASSSAGAPRSGGVKVKGADGSEVTLTGPVAAKYFAATDAQKKALGVVLTGDHNEGTRDSGVIFQQFKGGVITAKNANADTPAYITWGVIRDAWNIERDAEGKPIAVGGKNGSAGPLGAVTSDETTSGAVKQTTFEHGRITYNTQTRKTEVTVNGKVVPAGV